MGAQPQVSDESAWVVNYFNYFTEIEEHFQRARGTGLFLLSPLDWALIESWKNAEVPLEAVLRGIDLAFEKWRGRRVKTQMVNSLAFCAQAVLSEAQIMAGTAQPRSRREVAAPFALEELRAYLERNADALPSEYAQTAVALRQLAAEVEQHYTDLESLERRLTVLEEKMIAAARVAPERRIAARRARRTRSPTSPLPRQNDGRSIVHARKAIPRTQLTRKSPPAPAESLLYALASPQSETWSQIFKINLRLNPSTDLHQFWTSPDPRNLTPACYSEIENGRRYPSPQGVRSHGPQLFDNL